LRRPFDPDHGLDIADDGIAHRRFLGVGEPGRGIVDIENAAGFGVARGFRLVEVLPGEHGDKGQQHREGGADDGKDRARHVIVPLPEFEGEQLARRQSE